MGKVHTGIWIDSREALIFEMKKGSEHFERVVSNVEEYHVHGGARSPTPFGPQDAVKEKHYLQRKKQQQRQFYEKLLLKIAHSDEVLVCGPGTSKLGLEKAILNSKGRKYRLIGCHPLDSLTENQIHSWIRDKFLFGRSRSPGN